MIGKGCGRRRSWPHLRCTSPVLEGLNKITKALSVGGLWTEVCPVACRLRGRNSVGRTATYRSVGPTQRPVDTELTLLYPCFIHRSSSMYRNCATKCNSFVWNSLGAFLYSQKAPLALSHSSVCLSASMYQLHIYWKYSQETSHWLLLLTVNKIQIFFKSDRTVGTFREALSRPAAAHSGSQHKQNRLLSSHGIRG
jgi:hypothetical protein